MALLGPTHASADAAVDPGSLQAALDNDRYSADGASDGLTLSALYRGENMQALWSLDQANRLASLVSLPQAEAAPASAYERAHWDVQTSKVAIDLVEHAKARFFPQQRATAADLRRLKRAIDAGNERQVLRQLAVESSLSHQLRRAERLYSQAVAAGGWGRLDGTGLAPGERGAEVALLRARLRAEGYRPGQGDSFDGALRHAVQQYQLVQGLESSGAVDDATLRSLNVPAWRRLRTVRANIARFEAGDTLTTDNQIVVNIPAFNAEYYQGGRQVWSDRVIVGRTDRRTPQLASEIERVVFNPAWYVPSRIAKRDILPRASRDPAYWSRMGYLAYDGDGRRFDVEAGAGMSRVFADNGLRIKQVPGPKNALGQVKFLFPNKYAVYLHDTPNKKLFGRDVRAFSSGCVRVQEPLRLAQVLFENQVARGHDGMQSQSIDQVLAAKKTRSFELDEPVPVSTIYLTAEPLASGRVRFHDDIYRYDTAELASRAIRGGDRSAPAG